ncbi:hypothetical protein EJB05_35870, partial [Eragrostis curvula]
MIAAGREQVGRGWTGPYEVHLPGMVPSDRGSVATAVSTPAVTDKLLHGADQDELLDMEAPNTWKVPSVKQTKLQEQKLPTA